MHCTVINYTDNLHFSFVRPANVVVVSRLAQVEYFKKMKAIVYKHKHIHTECIYVSPKETPATEVLTHNVFCTRLNRDTDVIKGNAALVITV